MTTRPSRSRPDAGRTSLRRTAAAAAALLALAIIPPSAGAARPAGLPAGASDISRSAAGERLIREAEGRFAAYGVFGPLKAIRDRHGITIAPVGTPFVQASVTRPNGRTITIAAPVTPAASPVGGAESRLETAAAAATWNFQTGNCFARINHVYAWMDHCYSLYKMANDGSGTRDYFALQHWATMGANPPWTLWFGYLRAYRLAGTPTQNWADWSPRASWSGGSCSQINLSISVGVASLGVGVERCPEQWQMEKQNPAVDYELGWWGPHTRDERELAFEIAVWVNQGKWPQWVLPADADGSIG